MESVLALAVVGAIVGGMYIAAWRSGRRRRQRLNDPRTRRRELLRLGGSSAVAACVSTGVIIWANAGSGAMNSFGWLRYGSFLALFAGISIWAFIALRR